MEEEEEEEEVVAVVSLMEFSGVLVAQPA